MCGDPRELVTLRALDDAVEDEDVAVGLRREDEDILWAWASASVQASYAELHRSALGQPPCTHLEEGLLGVQDLLDPVLISSSLHIQSPATSLEGHGLSYTLSAGRHDKGGLSCVGRTYQAIAS